MLEPSDDQLDAQSRAVIAGGSRRAHLLRVFKWSAISLVDITLWDELR